MEDHAQSLLQKYQVSGSERAFAELVSQHVNLVYSVAVRQVGDPDSAKEICQLVFIKLSEKARTLDSNTILSGWLCRTARFICADHLKARYRREQREKEYVMQNRPAESEASIWESVSPCLDAALAELSISDQDLLALRFFEKKQFATIGLNLGINEAAAKMRTARALEKLRKILAVRGITVTFAALGALMLANAVSAVPSEIRTQILKQLASRTHSSRPPNTAGSRLRVIRILAPLTAVLLLAVAGVLIHSRLANHTAGDATLLNSETASKSGPNSQAEPSMAGALDTSGMSTNLSLSESASPQPVLTPYVPKIFSEDTDDLNYILDYVAAQLSYTKLHDSTGATSPLQVGLLGDPRYMTRQASIFNGASEIKRATNVTDLAGCSVVMIVVDDEDQIKGALAALADRPVITIGLHTNFLVWGGCINFITLDNLLNFGLNLDRARTINCTFSGNLTAAAAEIFANGKLEYHFAARPGDDTELDFIEHKNPFLPKGFTRRMKRLALTEAKRNAIIDAWRQYPANQNFFPDPNEMRDAMLQEQKEFEALRASGSNSIEAMQNISDRFNARADKFFLNNMNASIEADSRIRDTRNPRLALLEPVLTPDEFFAYRYLIDSEANKVANLLRVINITSDELRRIAFIFDEHAEPMVNGSLGPATDAILQQELGPVRYAQFKAAYSRAGMELTSVVLKYSNPLAHRSFFGTARLGPKNLIRAFSEKL